MHAHSFFGLWTSYSTAHAHVYKTWVTLCASRKFEDNSHVDACSVLLATQEVHCLQAIADELKKLVTPVVHFCTREYIYIYIHTRIV